MKKSKVWRSGGHVSKHYARDAEMEHAKSIQLWELSKASSFIASRPVSLDAASGIVKFEFIENLVSIRESFLNYVTNTNPTECAVDIFRNSGECLADIHNGLRLESTTDWIPSPVFRKAMQKLGRPNFMYECKDLPFAYLHGDYGFSNIHTIQSDAGKSIVIIDCSSDNYSTFRSDTYAPIYLDLAHLASCMDGLVPIRYYPLIDWTRSAELKECFVSGYEYRSGVSIDRQWLSYFSYCCVAAKFQSEFQVSVIPRVATWLVYNKIKGNCPN